MLVNISPDLDDIEETLLSLTLASKVAEVSVNTAKTKKKMEFNMD
jgi:hypothetical protein